MLVDECGHGLGLLQDSGRSLLPDSSASPQLIDHALAKLQAQMPQLIGMLVVLVLRALPGVPTGFSNWWAFRGLRLELLLFRLLLLLVPPRPISLPHGNKCSKPIMEHQPANYPASRVANTMAKVVGCMPQMDHQFSQPLRDEHVDGPRRMRLLHLPGGEGGGGRRITRP